MSTILHLTIHGSSPTQDWYVSVGNIAQVVDSTPVQIVPKCYPANMNDGSGMFVNESFSSIMAAIGSSAVQPMLTLTAHGVTPTETYYVPADSVTSISLNSNLGTIVNTTPTFASGGSWGLGQFQVNESPASIAAQIGNVAIP